MRKGFPATTSRRSTPTRRAASSACGCHRRPGTTRARAGSIRAASRAPGSRAPAPESICACAARRPRCATSTTAGRFATQPARSSPPRRSSSCATVTACWRDRRRGRSGASAASSARSRRRTWRRTRCRACRSPAPATSCRRSTTPSGSARARHGTTTTRRCAPKTSSATSTAWRHCSPFARRPTSLALGGRVGFRWASDDRLPIIGAVPASVAEGLVPGFVGARSPRFDQPRFVARAPGLFVCCALGSRGIASAALGAELLAAAITGAPLPAEADLLDAVDPARFLSRRFRQGEAARQRLAAGPGQPPVGPIAGSAGA